MRSPWALLPQGFMVEIESIVRRPIIRKPRRSGVALYFLASIPRMCYFKVKHQSEAQLASYPTLS
jgi:hypothetical protein